MGLREEDQPGCGQSDPDPALQARIKGGALGGVSYLGSRWTAFLRCMKGESGQIPRGSGEACPWRHLPARKWPGSPGELAIQLTTAAVPPYECSACGGTIKQLNNQRDRAPEEEGGCGAGRMAGHEWCQCPFLTLFGLSPARLGLSVVKDFLVCKWGFHPLLSPPNEEPSTLSLRFCLGFL